MGVFACGFTQVPDMQGLKDHNARMHVSGPGRQPLCAVRSAGVTDSQSTLAGLKDRILRARNADGGWGYYSGKSTRLEPTCWSLLALGEGVPADVLRTWPAVDGLLRERADGEPNYGFHGLAMLTLLDRKIEHQAGNAALVSGIQRVKGLALPDRGVNRQDNSIQAWSWIDGTFSWVEPTTYCLLALKKSRRAGLTVDEKRVADAEALMFDRVGVNGGWNYGNSNMLGQELPAYVPTTALGLLALQDRASHDAVRSSREYLERDALSERSSIALSLALIALRVLGRPVETLAAALVQQLPTAMTLGNLHAIALALYALRTDHADAAFVLH